MYFEILLFSLSLQGKGVFCIESYCPKEELIMIELENDVLKVDGNFAVAWSGSLEFTVENEAKFDKKSAQQIRDIFYTQEDRNLADIGACLQYRFCVHMVVRNDIRCRSDNSNSQLLTPHSFLHVLFAM